MHSWAANGFRKSSKVSAKLTWCDLGCPPGLGCCCLLCPRWCAPAACPAHVAMDAISALVWCWPYPPSPLLWWAGYLARAVRQGGISAKWHCSEGTIFYSCFKPRLQYCPRGTQFHHHAWRNLYPGHKAVGNRHLTCWIQFLQANALVGLLDSTLAPLLQQMCNWIVFLMCQITPALCHRDVFRFSKYLR